MKNPSYWLDKAGVAGVLLGPAETAARLVAEGAYKGYSQLLEGMGILTGGLAAWNAAKYLREEGIQRSPFVHLGRALEFSGAAGTEGILASGAVDNVYRAFGPAAIGIPVGAFLEYVVGPVHERFSPKYRNRAGKINSI